MVGEALYSQMRKRYWPTKEACVIISRLLERDNTVLLEMLQNEEHLNKALREVAEMIQEQAEEDQWQPQDVTDADGEVCRRTPQQKGERGGRRNAEEDVAEQESAEEPGGAVTKKLIDNLYPKIQEECPGRQDAVIQWLVSNHRSQLKRIDEDASTRSRAIARALEELREDMTNETIADPRLDDDRLLQCMEERYEAEDETRPDDQNETTFQETASPSRKAQYEQRRRARSGTSLLDEYAETGIEHAGCPRSTAEPEAGQMQQEEDCKELEDKKAITRAQGKLSCRRTRSNLQGNGAAKSAKSAKTSENDIYICSSSEDISQDRQMQPPAQKKKKLTWKKKEEQGAGQRQGEEKMKPASSSNS